MGRNDPARRAVFTLLTIDEPYSEGSFLRDLAAPLPVRVHVLPTQGLQATPLHIRGDVQSLCYSDLLLVSINGAVRATATGGGIMICHPQDGVLLWASFGCHVLGANPAEWCACNVAGASGSSSPARPGGTPDQSPLGPRREGAAAWCSPNEAQEYAAAFNITHKV